MEVSVCPIVLGNDARARSCLLYLQLRAVLQVRESGCGE